MSNTFYYIIGVIIILVTVAIDIVLPFMSPDSYSFIFVFGCVYTIMAIIILVVAMIAIKKSVPTRGRSVAVFVVASIVVFGCSIGNYFSMMNAGKSVATFTKIINVESEGCPIYSCFPSSGSGGANFASAVRWDADLGAMVQQGYVPS